MLKRVTIFLNPIANGERGKFLYDKNVAPLLHLSGLDVRLVRLEKNSEANAYMKELDVNDTDCIVVAGGNATLNEVISGLANRPDAKEFLRRIPIGIIPLGESNSFMKKWFENFSEANAKRSSNEKELRLFADSAMAIIKGVSQPAHLVKITLNQNNKRNASSEEDESLQMKKIGAYSLLKENQIYALSGVSCGFMTVTDANKDNYW
jgi:acylglycerol kinase